MYLLWRTLRFWAICGSILYTVNAITPQIFSAGDWLGKYLQTDGQRQTHASALAQLRASNLLFGGQQAPAPTKLLGAADQPASIQEYYLDAH